MLGRIRESRVYFVEGAGAIKIGTSTDVRSRLSTLQIASPYELTLLVTIPGDHERERALHDRFDRERLRGEWFRGDGELRMLVQMLSEWRGNDVACTALVDGLLKFPLEVVDDAKDIEEHRRRAALMTDAVRAFMIEKGSAWCAEYLGVLERYVVGAIEGRNHLRLDWLARLAPLSQSIRDAINAALEGR